MIAGIAYWGAGVSSDVVGQTISPGATTTNQYLTQGARVPGCTEGESAVLPRAGTSTPFLLSAETKLMLCFPDSDGIRAWTCVMNT